jgi:RNA recognition motif-containing protein
VAKKIYVGNLPFKATEEEITSHFAQCGEVSSVSVVKERHTGRSRGFGFVEMENADDAIAQLDGQEFGGRKLVVREAKERKPSEFRRDD